MITGDKEKHSFFVHSLSVRGNHWQNKLFHVRGILARDASVFYQELNKNVLSDSLLKASMTYVATIFFFLNHSFWMRVLPWRTDFWRRELAYVLMTVQKYHEMRITPLQKVVLVDCYSLLSEGNRKIDLPVKDLRQSFALRFAKSVLEDSRSSNVTILLMRAKMSRASFVTPEERDMHHEVVYNELCRVLRDPRRIIELENGWKSYIQLAQMIHFWEAMWFGLRNDSSLGIHITSYLLRIKKFFVR